MSQMLSQNGGGILGMFNMFSGGALGRMTVFALNIMPYITASIIVQLLTAAMPSLDQLQKEGESGRIKINQYTRYLTVFIAIFQSYGIAVGLESMHSAVGPAVADPGAELVRLAHERGIKVRPLVGPSSLLLAVMASGLNGQSFAFNGYLPTDAGQRTKRIQQLEQRSRSEKQTQLLIETPYRNGAMLDALVGACQPGTLVCVATDLSLPTETVRTQTAAKWKAQLASGKAPDFHKKPTVFLFLGQ